MNTPADVASGCDLPTIWRSLADAAATPRSPFRTPTLATIGRDGRPAARTVVLRRVAPADATLTAFTDRRSPKVAELLAEPRATWLFWDADARVQLRIETTCALHVNDESAATAWSPLSATARRDYRSLQPPSSPSGSDAVDALIDADGEANFALIVARVDRIDWLHLDSAGNRRAEFILNGASEATMRRLTP